MDVLKGGALMAILVGFWDKIKQFLWMGLSTFVQKAEIKTEDVHNEVIGHLISNYRKFNGYDKVFASQYESFRNGKYGLVSYEKFGDSLMIFLSKKKFFFNLVRIPFIFSNNNSSNTNKEENGDQSQASKNSSVIISLRGTVDVAEIVQEATIKRNRLNWDFEESEEKSNRFNIYYFPERKNDEKTKKNFSYGYSWFMQDRFNLLGVNSNELGREIKNERSALESLYFPKEVKQLIDLIRLWVGSKDWYKERNIPWKRGWLLYGIPGTGKTALARAFAEDLDLPIYFYSLAQMTNEQLIEAWQSMQLNVPCIALIEDIDNVFDKRKNIAQYSPFFLGNQFQQNNGSKTEDSNHINRTPLTFDTILNCIDGVDKTDGIFTIITTNDITKIDEAIGQPIVLEDGTQKFISTRPGRIDRAIELTYMTSENKIRMAEKILSEFPNRLHEVKLHIINGIEETPAQFQEYCCQIALKEHWKKNEQELTLEKRVILNGQPPN